MVALNQGEFVPGRSDQRRHEPSPDELNQGELNQGELPNQGELNRGELPSPTMASAFASTRVRS